MKTIEYLEQVKEKTGARSDYALAKLLGLSTAGMSHYRTGKRTIDDYTAAKVKVAFWRRLATSGKAASLASMLIVGGFLVESGGVDNLQSIHYANLLLYVILAGAGIGLTYKLWREDGKTRTF